MMRRNRSRSLRDVLQHQGDLCCDPEEGSASSSNNDLKAEVSVDQSTPQALSRSNSVTKLRRKAFSKSMSCSNLGRARSSKDSVRLDKEQKKVLKGKEERGSRLATLKLKEHKKNQPVLKKIVAVPLKSFRRNSDAAAKSSNDGIAGPQRRGVTRCLSGGNKLRMQ